MQCSLRYTQTVEHFDNSIIHYRRPAEIVFNILRFIKLAEIIIKEHLMNESPVTGPVI